MKKILAHNSFQLRRKNLLKIFHPMFFSHYYLSTIVYVKTRYEMFGEVLRNYSQNYVRWNMLEKGIVFSRVYKQLISREVTSLQKQKPKVVLT